MGNLHDLFLLLVLGGIVTAWMQLSRARELAVAAARHHCELHGLQLLDETVGLRAIRWRRLDGQRRVERGYGFDVSVDGDDRQQGRVWMIGPRVSGLTLPTGQWLVGGHSEAPAPMAPAPMIPPGPRTASNVVPLRRRLPNDPQ
ncbi:MAG TPA: DUF3301 domain-containing protein [Dyella sp.]|nr:DUF3301 domain-containing protein [Dyella sp.]